MIHAALELASAGKALPGGFVHRMQKELWDYPLDEFQQAYDAGIRSFVLFRPTGAVNIDNPETDPYDLKMSLFARQVLQHDPRCTEILRTMGRFLIDFKRRYPGARIIAYFGTARGWTCAFPQTDEGYKVAWQMAMQAMQPWLQSDIVDICFDEAGSLREGDPYGYIIDKTAEYIGPDRTVYVEAWPQPWSTTSKYKSLRTEYWQSRWGDTRADQIGGILFLNGHGVNYKPEWRDYAKWARHRLSQGHEIAIGPEHIPVIVEALGLDTAKGGK